MRQCLCYTRECSFCKMVSIHRTDVSRPFSFTRYAPRHTLITYSWISSYNWALDQVFAQSCPFMIDFSSSELWMKFSTLSRGFLLRWNCGSKLIKSYLDTSHFEPLRFIAWASPSEVVFWYCAFLLKSLKLDGNASLHSSCTIPCALWLHHIISINTQVHLSLEQECRHPIPLECIIDNLAAITCFCWSLLEVYTFGPWSA
jgi:hypothetical protein